MTELSFTADSLYELQTDETVWVGDTPYFVSKFSRGGMGFVIFLSRDDEHAPQSHLSFVHGPGVAVKSVLPADGDPTIHQLFQRELTMWAGLRHPGIVQLNEILSTRSDGWVAAMDWCVGSLSQLLDERTSLKIDEALFIIRDLVSGLHYASSEHGIFHLDLKPGNILYKHVLSRMIKSQDDPIRQYGWQVSDWGLASVKSAALARLTSSPSQDDGFKTLNNLGTTAYMAPERFVPGTRSSVASDLFAVGLVLYEMLMGRLPYQANSDVIEQIRTHTYFSVAKILLAQQRVPSLLAETILKLIRPNPNERCSGYPELLERLNLIQRPSSLLSRFFKF